MKKTFHILYLSYDGLTDPLGQSQVLPYILETNQNEKYKFTIVSFEKKDAYSANSTKIKELLSKNTIDWIPINYNKNPPVLSTLFDIIKLYSTIKKIKSKEKVHLLHCRSYIPSLTATKQAKKYNIPFIFDMRGFYADERVDGKIWSKSHFIYKHIYNYFKKKEKEFLQSSQHTISLTKNGKKEIESWNLPNQSPISIIPCCSDEKLFKKQNIIDKRTELGIHKDDFVISYVGSIGTWYMLDEMLDFFKELTQKKENTKLLFITKDNPQHIFNKADEFGIKQEAIIIKSSSREMMPSYIGLSNFSIFFILPVYSKKASSPTKMGEIMNLGIPIICNSGVGDVDEIMEKCMPELLVKEFTKKEYNRVIDTIINNYKVNKVKIQNISNEYYSLEKGVEKYKAIYKNILEEELTHGDTFHL